MESQPNLDPEDRPDRGHLYDSVKLSLDWDPNIPNSDAGVALVLKPDAKANWELHLSAAESDAFKGLSVELQVQISMSEDPFDALWKMLGAD